MKNKSVTRILIIGLGQLGLPVAKHVKERGGMEYTNVCNPVR
jgi:3-hydroxyisobutyrate dehydrogenase-like beta-hydroxyacid dehydrogenase